MATSALQQAILEQWTDEQVVERVLAGDTALYEIIMRRYNQRLYRVTRAILRDDSEAEDVMQDAYVRAYQHLDQFAGRAKFSTWLTRIAVNEALARATRRGRVESLDEQSEWGEIMSTVVTRSSSPEQQVSERETVALLEQAILALPQSYRTILTLRDIQELDTAETAEILGIREENVKVRLHRARALLRRELLARVGSKGPSAFEFNAVRCDRVVAGVFDRLRQEPAL